MSALRALVLLASLSAGWALREDPLLVLDAHSSRLAAPEELTFQQPLSHFNALASGTIQQRYWVNASFFDAARGGPLFVTLQGEWTASASCASSGYSVVLAQQFGALVVCVEVRCAPPCSSHHCPSPRQPLTLPLTLSLAAPFLRQVRACGRRPVHGQPRLPVLA